MKNETYLMINGQKIELTEEQKKQLGIVEKQKQNCFDRKAGQTYYYINFTDAIITAKEAGHNFDDNTYNVANYCTDKNIMHQRAMHETLNRLLWRYSMTHDGDKIDWSNRNLKKYNIIFNHDINQFLVAHRYYTQNNNIYFNDETIAYDAIEEIIKPFMKEHPDFVW